MLFLLKSPVPTSLMTIVYYLSPLFPNLVLWQLFFVLPRIPHTCMRTRAWHTHTHTHTHTKTHTFFLSCFEGSYLNYISDYMHLLTFKLDDSCIYSFDE
jgi:hypothetical protein